MKIAITGFEILTQVYDEPMGPIGQGVKRLIGVDYILMDTPSGDHTIREISTFLLFRPLSLGHFLPVSSPSPQSRPH